MSPTQCGGLAGGLCPILGYLGSRLPPHRSPSPPAGSQHWAVPHRQFGGAAPPHAPPGFCCPSLRLLPPPGLRPPGKPPPGPAPSPAPSPDWLSCGHAPRWPRPHCATRFPPGSAPNLHWLHPHVTAIQSVLLPPSLAPPPFSQQHEEPQPNWPTPGQSEHTFGASQSGRREQCTWAGWWLRPLLPGGAGPSLTLSSPPGSYGGTHFGFSFTRKTFFSPKIGWGGGGP